eukprot:1160160-Pelagomonas_calceolata.AAC.4
MGSVSRIEHACEQERRSLLSMQSPKGLLPAPIHHVLSSHNCFQAHYNAQQHAEEFVVELLVSLDKMQVLVQNLLAIEVCVCVC